MKKIVFIVLTLLLLTGLCLGIGFAAMAADSNEVNELEQTIMAGYALPEIPDDAQPIHNGGQLYGMDPNGVYYLAADIEVGSSCLLPFSGTLYGNGHTVTVQGSPVFFKLDGATVRDLTIVGSVTNTAASRLDNVGGLVREAYNATIIGITNKASIVQEVYGKFAGGVAGYAENTTFSYCVNYGNISGNTSELRPGGIMGQCNNASAWIALDHCINHGTINGVNQTGGLVSRIENGASLRISDCANFGTVNVAGSDSGGIIGKVTQTTTEVTFERVYNSGRINGGKISGGIVGPFAGQITVIDAYNGCFVDGCDCNGTDHGKITQKAGADIGGLFGSVNNNAANTVYMEKCYNYGDVYTTFKSRIGGLAGCMEAKTVTAKNCHNYGDLDSADYGGGLFSRAGASAGTLVIEDCSNNGNVTVNSYGGGFIGYQQNSLGIRMVNCVNNGTISTSWNAAGLLCRIDGNVVAMTTGIEFINCVNNGNIVKSSGTSGGILGILEPGDLNKIPYLTFNACHNYGDIFCGNYAGGITGIAQALQVSFSNCTNSGDMIFDPNSNDNCEFGGIAGRIYGILNATDCVNTGDVFVASAPLPSTRTSSVMLGGIVGRAGQSGSNFKHEVATFTRCINTGVIGNDRAFVDGATTYSQAAGGIVGLVRATCKTYYCVSAGDVFGNQQVAGICALSGQNEIAAHTYYGNYISANLYNSGHKGQYNSAGAAGISCYGWGNVNVERNVMTGNVEVNNTGSGKAIGDRWVCSAFFGYTNNAGGNFKYNYFTGTLTTDGGDNCYKIIVANTKSQDHTSREGNEMAHNYSVTPYNLHCNEKIGYSVSKASSITPEAMQALAPTAINLVKLCDGTVVPVDTQTVRTMSTALNIMGHTYSSVESTADPMNHKQSCACGAAVYARHEYENACDTDCDICGYVRFEQPTHEGEFACSETCKHCDAPVTPTAAHAGKYACSTTCETCGVAVVGSAHTVSSACDTACNLCGEAVAATADHTTAKPCDSTCSACGEAVEGADHQGEFDCSKTCQWCDAEVEGTAHEGELECSTVCKHCGAAISGTKHLGASACSETCQWCGVAITPTAEHTAEFVCSTACATCGAELDGACEGEFACSMLCKHCDGLITPDADHTAKFACSTVCLLCGGAVYDADEHTFDNACDADCNVCGEKRSVEHAWENPCDTDCGVCGFERDVECKGEEFCSNICQWCNATIQPLFPHTGKLACSETCQWCEAPIAEADRDAHTYDNNCDTVCNVCSAARTVEPHVGEFPCSETCRWCEIAITPADHVYDNSCDPGCNNCGAIRPNAKHTYDNDCDPDCNKKDCDYVRFTEIPHVYDNDCDKDCNVCRVKRFEEAQHVYDNTCDQNCNICNFLNVEADHTYADDCDGTCDVCGATRDAAHEFGTCSGICTKCEKQIRDDAHDFGDWVVTLQPTVEAEGSREHTCATCGETVAEPIEKLPAAQEKGNDMIILIVAAAALVLFNVVVIVISNAKKKKNNKDPKEAEAKEAEQTEAPEKEAEAETTEEAEETKE